MFFQEPTPDTSGYMIAGYTIAFIVMGIYVLSLYIRNRNLRQDMSMLEEIEDSAAKAKVISERQKGLEKPKSRKSARTVTKRSKKK